MSKKVAIILSGCGAVDGAEVQESVCSILAIEKHGMEWNAFSLDEDQKTVLSAVNSEPLNQKRNILEESARITHGAIEGIDLLNIDDFDVLWLPGGYGVATSFSDIAEKGVEAKVHPKISSVIENFNKQQKAIVGLCIAPSIIAKSLDSKSIKLTLGQADVYMEMLKKLGHTPEAISSESYVYDEKNNIYTSPAYMDKTATCLKIFQSCDKIAAKINEG